MSRRLQSCQPKLRAHTGGGGTKIKTMLFLNRHNGFMYFGNSTTQPPQNPSAQQVNPGKGSRRKQETVFFFCFAFLNRNPTCLPYFSEPLHLFLSEIFPHERTPAGQDNSGLIASGEFDEKKFKKKGGKRGEERS